MENTNPYYLIDKSAKALAALVESEGGPSPEHFAHGRAVLAELRAVLNPAPEKARSDQELSGDTAAALYKAIDNTVSEVASGMAQHLTDQQAREGQQEGGGDNGNA